MKRAGLVAVVTFIAALGTVRRPRGGQYRSRGLDCVTLAQIAGGRSLWLPGLAWWLPGRGQHRTAFGAT